MADTPTLVIFEVGFEPAGVGADGLPLFAEVVKIRKSRPPYLELLSAATDEDIEDNPHAYAAFQKSQKGKKLDGRSGYPLAMWPAINAAELHSCLVRDVATVEQLAKLALSRDDKVPAPIIELAKRAKKMIDLHTKTGKHEEVISGLEAQVKVLTEQLSEQRITLEHQTQTIMRLQAQPQAA